MQSLGCEGFIQKDNVTLEGVLGSRVVGDAKFVEHACGIRFLRGGHGSSGE